MKEQKPVAWMYVGTHVTKPISTDDVDYEQIAHDDTWFPVYLQPQRTWVELTDEELPPLVGDNGKYMELQQVRRFYKYIEAKLKEKNT